MTGTGSIVSSAVAGGGHVTPFEANRRPGGSDHGTGVIMVRFPVSGDDLLAVLWAYLSMGVAPEELDAVDDAEMLATVLLFGMETVSDHRRAVAQIRPGSDMDDLLEAARSRVARLCGPGQ